ncbi:MAG: HAD-IB family hydrolase [Clostridia bacterium]|nr:HAD-IB family hydrolase [Clostridia bacterium]
MQKQPGLPRRESPVSLALFDFDGTLIPGDSVAYYLRFARKQRAVNAGEFLRALWAAAKYGMKRMSDADSKSAALAFRKRHDSKALEELDRTFVQHVLLPKVYADGKKRMEELRREGKILALVSASTENYMRFVAEALGFDVLLATPIEPDGTVKRNCKGEAKARRVEAWLAENGLTADFASSWAFGDSKSDLPMLRLCGHPVQVNPRKALREMAPEMETVIWKQ